MVIRVWLHWCVFTLWKFTELNTCLFVCFSVCTLYLNKTLARKKKKKACWNVFLLQNLLLHSPSFPHYHCIVSSRESGSQPRLAANSPWGASAQRAPSWGEPGSSWMLAPASASCQHYQEHRPMSHLFMNCRFSFSPSVSWHVKTICSTLELDVLSLNPDLLLASFLELELTFLTLSFLTDNLRISSFLIKELLWELVYIKHLVLYLVYSKLTQIRYSDDDHDDGPSTFLDFFLHSLSP